MPKLTKTFVDKIDKEGWYRDTDLKGFAIRARRGTDGILSKTYVINKRVRGTQQVVTVTIGRHGAMSNETARVEAQKVLSSMAQGENPNILMQDRNKEAREELDLRTKTAKLEAKTLEDLLLDYLRTHTLKEKTRLSYERLVRRLLSDWLSVPIIKITRDMVQERHLELSAEHPAQANGTMRILRALFTYAVAIYEDGKGKPLLAINPVDRLRHARLWNKIPRRQRLIKPSQLKSWYRAVMKVSAEARDVLLIEIFTGFRQSEAMGLRWENIDFDEGTMLVKDTKNGTDHMIPMSTYLTHIIKERFELTGLGTFVFPGRGASGHVTDIRDSIELVIKECRVPFSEHDLRRTFETTAESLDISYYTLKKLLNHKTGNDPTAGYIVTSTERMRQAAQIVANTLAKQMGMPEPPKQAAGVVRLRKRVIPIGKRPRKAQTDG